MTLRKWEPRHISVGQARLRSRFRLLISGILPSLPNPAWTGGNLQNGQSSLASFVLSLKDSHRRAGPPYISKHIYKKTWNCQGPRKEDAGGNAHQGKCSHEGTGKPHLSQAKVLEKQSSSKFNHLIQMERTENEEMRRLIRQETYLEEENSMESQVGTDSQEIFFEWNPYLKIIISMLV